MKLKIQQRIEYLQEKISVVTILFAEFDYAQLICSGKNDEIQAQFWCFTEEEHCLPQVHTFGRRRCLITALYIIFLRAAER